MKEHKEQVSVITYPKGGNNHSAFVAHHVAKARAAGFTVVYRSGHATVHKS